MRFNWIEISNGLGNAPAWSLAARGDGPVTTPATAGAALVQIASVAANDRTVTHAINRNRPAVETSLRRIFNGHSNGGVLVVAGMESRHGGQRFEYLTTFMGVYARPEHALSRWRQSLRLENADVHRFFWVTRR